MALRLLLLIIAPFMASCHGVASNTAQTDEELRMASGHAFNLVQKATEQCSKEVSTCAAMNGLSSQYECLVKSHDDLSWDCKLQVLNMVRHMPHTNITMEKMNNKAEVSVSDIGHRTYKGCNYSSDGRPYVWSYHIHFMWNELTDSTTKQMSIDFHNKFIKEFAPNIKYCRKFSFLTDLWNKDSVTGPENHEFAETCMFPSLPPGGPFFLWERGYLISPTMFHKVVPWMAANRPVISNDAFGRAYKHRDDPIGILIHPNTGCQYNDLNHYSMWAGPSKPLFYDILMGCVWAACEDEVLGCIGFNHLGKNQGYGVCYKAPQSMKHECTMTIEPTSNTTTMDCKKPSTTVV